MSEKEEKEEKEKKGYDTLVLSGGGVKGFSTLGALQYMQDNGLLGKKLNKMIGTSVGSMICFFLSIGYTPIELVVSLCSEGVFESLKINSIENILKEGVYNYNIINEHCKKLTIDKIKYVPTLSQLKEAFDKELIISTYNYTEQKQEYINYKNYPDLSCLDAIRMSSNLPFIFNDFEYMNNEYIDGGFGDNFPLNCSNDDELVMGISLKDEDKVDIENDKGVIDKFYKLILIPLIELYKIKLEPYKNKNNIHILELKIENIKLYKFNLSHSEKLELFSVGYNQAKSFFKKEE